MYIYIWSKLLDGFIRHIHWLKHVFGNQFVDLLNLLIPSIHACVYCVFNARSAECLSDAHSGMELFVSGLKNSFREVM